MTEVPTKCRPRRRLLGLSFKTKSATLMFAGAIFSGIFQHTIFAENESWAGYAAGLATELCGVALTIILIDMALERQEQRKDIRRLADEMLFQVDYIVWVWLGGDRVFSYEEMVCLLRSVSPDDTLHHVTESLIQGLGNEAEKRYRLHSDLVLRDGDLCRGLCHLGELASIRARKHPLEAVQVGEALLEAARSFRRVLQFTETGHAARECQTQKQSAQRIQVYRHTGMEDAGCPEPRAVEVLTYLG
ncbi:MAG TPA: hypothetical protein DEF41_15015 [Desulfovibrio sp.]|nr:hypothetical protein [Desulfovibrio sp.]